MTIHPAGTRGDAILVESSAVEVLMAAAAGAIPGLVILATGGGNGPGAGTLRQDAGTKDVSWQAPGSATFGAPIDVAAGGSFVLEDGDDPDSWVRVSVSPTFQAAGAADALAQLQDVYNRVGPDDITAAEATAGAVEVFTLDLTNQSGMEVVGLKAWLDPATVDLEISDDGAVWVTPTTEGTALALGNLLPAAADILHVRRTIGAASPSDVAVLNLIHLSWVGL